MSFPTFFTPYSTAIQNISRANPGVVTTTTDNGYGPTLLARIVFPEGSNFGMEQVNGEIFEVTPITSNTFSIGIDTRTFDAFTLGTNKQVAQVIPVGETGSGFLEVEQNNHNIKPET